MNTSVARSSAIALRTARASARIATPIVRSLRASVPVTRTARHFAPRTVIAQQQRCFSRSSVARSQEQEPELAPSKIYSFEDVTKISSGASPSAAIIDVREPGELQDTGKIPHAINIPISTSPDAFFLPEEEFEDKFGFERPPKDQEVIFYCKAGVRSRAAAGLAKAAGWTNVSEYPGSWNEWFSKRGKVERS